MSNQGNDLNSTQVAEADENDHGTPNRDPNDKNAGAAADSEQKDAGGGRGGGDQEREKRMRRRDSMDDNLRQQRQQVQDLLAQLNQKIEVMKESHQEHMEREDDKSSWMNHIEHLEASNAELQRRIEEEVRAKQDALRQRIALKYEMFEWRKRCEELEASNRNWESRMAHLRRLEALNDKLKERIEEEIAATEREKRERIACKYDNVELKRRCAELEKIVQAEKETSETRTAEFQKENAELKEQCAELEALATKWKEEAKSAIAKSKPSRVANDAIPKAKSSRFIDGEASKSFSEENILLREQVRELTAKVTTQKKRTQEYKELWTRWQRECQTAEGAVREWVELGNVDPLQQFMRDKHMISNLTSTDALPQLQPQTVRQQAEPMAEGSASPSHSDPCQEDHNPTSGPRVFVGQTKTPAKVVIGIDFGTAYSGISILYTDVPDMVHNSAPGAQASSTKVPTVLLRGPNDFWAFGHDALDRYVTAIEDCEEDLGDCAETAKSVGLSLFRNYRTELDGETEGLDTLTGTSETGEEHSLMELFTRTLSMLSGHAMMEVKRSWGEMLDIEGESKDVQWVLSVPAGWNEFERDFLRIAARKAGLISDEASECLHLVSEPEAASLCVNMDAPDLHLLQEGSSFTIVDCGGETVDISSFHTMSQEPLILDAQSPSCSVPFGGKHVDGAFRSFLGDFFGEGKMETFYQVSPAAVESVVDEFRIAKESFDLTAKDSWYVVSMSELVENNDNVDLSALVEAFNARMSRRPKRVFSLNNNKVKKSLERGKLTFSHSQMQTIFFKPSLDGITSAVREELAKCGDPVTFIVVVGGYGACKAVVSSLETNFPQQTVVTAEIPQAAVMKGASLFGLYSERTVPSISSPHTQQVEGDVVVVSDEETMKELEQLKEDLANLHEEKRRLETAREQDDSKVAHLQKALEESKRQTGVLQNQVNSLQRQAQTASTMDNKETNRKALTLLLGATVKRSDSPRNNASSPTFPTGREISNLAVKLQYAVSDFLHSLHDALLEWEDYSGAKDTVSSYGAVLDKIIMQSWDVARMYVSEFEQAKLTALSAFLGSSCTMTELRSRVETDNSVLKVLWVHSMQEAVNHLSSQKGQILAERTEALQGDEELIRWAVLPETTGALQELDVPSWESFTEDLILLLLFCKYSDPPCYLWPYLGDETSFSPDLHKVEAFPGLAGRKKPKAGEMVRVLLPGLYFEDPTLDSSIEAKTKAIIIALPRM